MQLRLICWVSCLEFYTACCDVFLHVGDRIWFVWVNYITAIMALWKLTYNYVVMLSPACLPVFKQVRNGDSSSVDVRLNCVKALIACKVFAVAGWSVAGVKGALK